MVCRSQTKSSLSIPLKNIRLPAITAPAAFGVHMRSISAVFADATDHLDTGYGAGIGLDGDDRLGDFKAIKRRQEQCSKSRKDHLNIYEYGVF